MVFLIFCFLASVTWFFPVEIFGTVVFLLNFVKLFGVGSFDQFLGGVALFSSGHCIFIF